ncbi:MAG: preprotein translocase subunit YajC [Candidatus Krumholzibacteriota bacterium]|nr:preprotein translocase subunit YajC [Candidatus Krumholzibacteriota bacterium]
MSYLMFLYSAGAGGSEGGGSLLVNLLPIVAIFVIFYFILIRPQQKKQKEHRDMVSKLSRGDRIVTNGGLHGKVVDVKDHIIVIKISDDVKVELVKTAVATVLEKKEE